MNFSQEKLVPKQLNLNKLGDPGGSQIHRPATLAKTDSSSYFGITQNPEFLPTNAEPEVVILKLYHYKSILR